MKKVLLLSLLSFLLSGIVCAQRVSAQENNGFESEMQGWGTPVIKPRPGQKPGRIDVNIVAAPAHKVHGGNKALQFDTEAWSPSITVKSDLSTLR